MKQKNLIYIFADQWRSSSVGFVGEEAVETPNIDQFREEATNCDQVFSSFPLCSPHRASLMTGKYPLSAGFFTNAKPGLKVRLQDHEVGVGDTLKKAGYQTAYIGKWHLDEPEVNHEEEPVSGARNWDAFTPPGPRRHGFDYWYSYGTYDEHLHPHYWQDTPEMIQVDEWSVAHETEKAIEYLEEKRQPDQPFAMYLSWNPPHSPYEKVPEKYLNLYKDKDISLRKNVEIENLHHHTGEQEPYDEEGLTLATKRYYAAISGIDDHFSKLIEYLKETGLYEDTIIVLSSDHGDMLGSQGLMGKHVWYEEAIHIPCIFRVPGNNKETCHTIMASQDMMPTILGLLDIAIPETVEGEDCSSYILTDQEDYDRVSFILACPGRATIVEKYKEHHLDSKDFGWRAVRTQTYTYVMSLGYNIVADKQRHLYNIAEDPYQMNSLDVEKAENQEIIKTLEGKLTDWMMEQKDGFIQNWLAQD